MNDAQPGQADPCPYLVPVTADALWVYPVAAFCRRPDHPIQVPGAATIEERCATMGHRRCPGYLAAGGGASPALTR
jgi:hypothetical protein